jgi:hypothetical protein
VKTRITVHVTPRSGRDSIEAGAGGVLQIRVTAAPDEGKANAAVCKVLADKLDVPKTSVRVVRGQNARTKQIEVDVLSPDEVSQRLSR